MTVPARKGRQNPRPLWYKIPMAEAGIPGVRPVVTDGESVLEVLEQS